MPLSTATLELFWARMPAELRSTTDRATLAEVVGEGLRAAAEAWPELGIDEEGFVLRVASRLGSECPLAALAWADLALVDACLRQESAALAAFEAGYGPALRAALAAARVDADARDEALQRLRLRLFVREDGAPRLASYAGRGSLRVWLRVAALREAMMLARAGRRRAAHEEATDDDELLAQVAVVADPEWMLVQGDCRAALRGALAGALAGLDSRERTLLRLALRDRLSVDQIGALYRVHRSTAARWLQAVRDRLATATRSALAAKYGLADAEVESLIRAVGSRIDLSLESITSATPTA